MSGLATELERYLELRRQMGFKLHRAEKLLRQFVTYCETHSIEVITAAIALQWARLPERPSPAWVSMRLQVVRGFTRHLSLIDERHQAVPTSLVAARPTRATPYLYSEQEVTAMTMAAHRWAHPCARPAMRPSSGCYGPRACVWARRSRSTPQMSTSPAAS